MSGSCDSSPIHWYALRTRSRHEKAVRDRLAGNGFEPFLPLTKISRQWSDRKMVTELPLFSGYCFARFSLRSRVEVLQIPGVVTIVGNIGPEPIPLDEVEALKTIASSRRICDPCHFFYEGAWVEVIQGPLKGIRGRFVRRAGQDCIVIQIQLLRQAAAVHIDAQEVIAVA